MSAATQLDATRPVPRDSVTHTSLMLESSTLESLQRGAILMALMLTVMVATGSPLLLAQSSGAQTAPATAQEEPDSVASEDATSDEAAEEDTGGAERLRNALLSIHGFDRLALEATGTGIPGRLKAMIDNTEESSFIRRQATKALGLFPSDDIYTFIVSRLEAASLGEKRLLLIVLRAFGKSKPEAVRGIVTTYLDDPNLTVRYAALSLAANLPPDPETWNLLRARLPVESNSGLRKAIERRLPGPILRQ